MSSRVMVVKAALRSYRSLLNMHAPDHMHGAVNKPLLEQLFCNLMYVKKIQEQLLQCH